MNVYLFPIFSIYQMLTLCIYRNRFRYTHQHMKYTWFHHTILCPESLISMTKWFFFCSPYCTLATWNRLGEKKNISCLEALRRRNGNNNKIYNNTIIIVNIILVCPMQVRQMDAVQSTTKCMLCARRVFFWT